MRILLLTVVAALFTQAGGRPSIEHTTFAVEGHGDLLYAISVPADFDPAAPRPLILALHPGGKQGAYYGSQYLQRIFEPALRDWNAVMVAPDAPVRSWTDDTAERAVMGLVEHVLATHAIDRTRILVTGFSMGGRGTWFFATRHPDLFTGAIPIAGSLGDAGAEWVDAVADMPVHIIHSRADEVVPFGPAEEAAERLAAAGGRVAFTPLDGVGHFAMGGYVGALRDAGDWMREQWDR